MKPPKLNGLKGVCKNIEKTVKTDILTNIQTYKNQLKKICKKERKGKQIDRHKDIQQQQKTF